MALCCPPGRGCNESAGNQPCVLKLCREMAGEEPRAALALARWEEWMRARRSASTRERRFRRRAYERARDGAIVAVLMSRARAEARPRVAGRTRRATGLRVLVGHYRAARRR